MENKKESKTYAVIGILTFVFIMSLFILLGQKARAQEVGFLVAFESYETKGTEILKLHSFSEVYSVLATKFDHKIKSKVMMEGTNIFVIETGIKYFYCEMKKVNKRGNLRRKRMSSDEVNKYIKMTKDDTNRVVRN